MIPCESCSIGNAKQYAINKHVNNNKKAMRTGERIFSDLVTIKTPQESSITITKKNWHIVMDQDTGYKESQFHCINSDFVEPTCKRFSKWKNNGKPVTYIKHNNASENEVLIKIANYSQWKLKITVEYT